jgi:branched-chain amino acid transport system substrate-binding protein
MNRYLTGMTVAALAAAVLFTTPAVADHRPGNVVVMGGTLGLTGHYAVVVKRYINVCNLYVEELNARGGLLGHKVELKIYDDKSDRRTAIELYEKLITEDKVDLVLGPYSSNLTDAVANVMERYKRPFLAPGAASPVIWQRGRRYVFKGAAGVPAPDYHQGALQLAKQLGLKRIAIIGGGELMPRQATEGALEGAKMFGIKVVVLESYRKEQTEFTALLQRIEASGAEAIISSGYFDDTVAQVRQLRELNINVKIFAGTEAPAIPKFIEELGSTAEFMLGFSHWEPKPVLGFPGMKEFIENYEKRYGGKPNFHAAGSYCTMQVYEAAVKEAGSFDPRKIRDAMASIAVDTVRGRWKANEQGFATNPEGGLTIQIQNGKRVIVWPAHKAEAKFLPMPKWEDRGKK